MARIKSSRLLRALAVFFMVPVVVFSTPTMAGAAESGTMTFHLNGGGLEGAVPGVNNTTCQLPWAVNAGGIIINSSARCDGGPDYSPGTCQPFEGACGSWSIAIKDGTGGTLGSTSFEPFDIGGGITSVKAGLGGGFVPIGEGIPSQACLTHIYSAFGANVDDAVTDCVSLTVDSPEVPEPTGCTYGTVTQPQITRHELERDGTDWGKDSGQYSSHHWRILGTGGGTTTATEVAGKPWVVYYVYPRTTGATGASVGPSVGGGPEHLVIYQTVTPGPSAPWTLNPQGWTTQNFYPNWPGQPQYPQPNIVGVGAFRLPQDVSQALALTGTDARRRVGITDPSQCSWYWGTKVAADLPGTTGTADPVSPMGPIVTEPEYPDPPDVVVPVDDTPEDDTGIWAGILALLRSILRAIGGLVGAILDGIKRLFLPSDGFMEGKWAGVEAKWDDTSPGKYLDTLSGIQAGSVSGCGGLPLNVNLGYGISVDEHIGAACSGSMASAASVTRAVVTAMVAIGGAIACVRAVGSGLGWNPGLRADT